MLLLKEINIFKELRKFSTLWNQLLQQSELNNIFLTWEWVSTWIQTYIEPHTENIKLFILIIYKNNDLIGIAPFYIKKARILKGIKLNRLGFLGDNEVCSDYLGFIIKKNKENEVIPKIFDYLFNSDSWEIASLESIQPNLLFFDVLLNYFEGKGKFFKIENCAMCPCIRLPKNPDSVFQILSRKRRYIIKRNWEELKNKLRYKTYEDFPSLDESFNIFINLHQKRCQSKGLLGAFSKNTFLNFHQKICNLFAQRGWLRINFFLLEDKPIAASYGFSYGKKYYYYLTGIDTKRLEKYSIGMLLLYKSIKDAIKEGCEEFDLLRGNELYKLVWATHYNRTFRVNFFSKSLKSSAYVFYNQVKELTKILVR